MERRHITKAVVEKAPVPASGASHVRDDEIRGFGFRVIPTGTRTFFFEARVKGRSRRINIGRYPGWTVLAARLKAVEIRNAIAHGEDPAAEAQAAKQEMTFGELAAEYMRRHARPHKRSADDDEAMLKGYIPPSWNSRRLSDISSDDVSRLHAQIGARLNPQIGQPIHYAANRLLALLQTMFNLAQQWKLFKGDNPASGIKRFKEYHRERDLNVEELERLNAALLEEPDWRWKVYFPLCVALGTRRMELLSARWDCIDLQGGTWLIPKTKTGRSLLLPLAPEIVAMLKELPSRGRSEWVFPGKGSSGHLVEPKKAWARILKRAGVAAARVHDLRHTAASLLRNKGYDLQIIGRALGHSNLSTTQRYAHLQLSTLRPAMDTLAAQVLGKRKSDIAQ
jgi:integrase